VPAIAVRQDYDAAQLGAIARVSKDARQVRPMLALAAVYDGAGRSEAAALGGMDQQILRDWALRFNAERPRLADRPRSAGGSVEAHARAAIGRDAPRGGWPDPGRARGGSLAADGSGRVDLRRIRRVAGPQPAGPQRSGLRASVRLAARSTLAIAPLTASGQSIRVHALHELVGG
jgi:hypothetical protein